MKKINLITLVLLLIFTPLFLSGCSNQAVYTENKGCIGEKSRTDYCIQLVFQSNKGEIYSIYNDMLRSNSTLGGTIILKLQLNTSGKVVRIVIVNNEIKSKLFTQKLVSAIKNFDFHEGRKFIFTYPLTLLPS